MSDIRRWKPVTVQPVEWPDLHYTVIDLETTIRNTGEDAVGKQQAAPYHPDNKIWLYGSTESRPMHTLTKDSFSNEMARHKVLNNIHLSNNMFAADIMVGQNFKFDLVYLLVHHKKDLLRFLRRGGIIWDTMQAEYLLTNQQAQFAALGSKYKVTETVMEDTGTLVTEKKLIKRGMAEKYGGVDKDDRIAEYWNNGVDTPDIPQNELVEYLDGDLKNTAIVFREQYKLSMNRGPEFMNLIQTQMQAIVATAFAEYNGMKFDLDKAAQEAMVMAKEHDKIEKRLRNYMADELNLHGSPDDPVILGEDCNPGSVQQLSTMLFGGTFKHTKRLQVVDEHGNGIFLKTGANKGDPKMRNETIEVVVDPRTALCALCKHLLEQNTLGYVLDDPACKIIMAEMGETSVTGVFLKNVLKYRDIGKDLNTYYVGLMNLTWPTDTCIHGNLNHCATGTGRLSSNAPNMQNVSG